MTQSIEINIQPVLPRGRPWLPEEKVPVGEIFWQLHDINHELFTLTFVIGAECIQYYPANLGTIISDLVREHELSTQLHNHTVEFSGYTVALAEIVDGSVVFRSAAAALQSENEFGVVSLSEYLMKLRQEIGSALDYVRGINT